MGTHPIFESDFDCLTDVKLRNDGSEERERGAQAEVKITEEEGWINRQSEGTVWPGRNHGPIRHFCLCHSSCPGDLCRLDRSRIDVDQLKLWQVLEGNQGNHGRVLCAVVRPLQETRPRV